MTKGPMIKTGISEIDDLLAGGIPEGKSLAYYVQPGVDGEIFGLQIVYNTLKNGCTCVIVASSMSPDNIRNMIGGCSTYCDVNMDYLLFVDSYNPLIGNPSREKYVISDPYNIKEFNNTVINILKEFPPSIIVFGSLSTIMDLCGEKKTINAVKTWNNLAKLYGHILVYNFTAWPYSQETIDLIKNQLFNAVIAIGGRAGHTIFSRYFGILKFDWKDEPGQTIYSETECCKDFSGMFVEPSCHYLEYEIEGANIRIVKNMK